MRAEKQLLLDQIKDKIKSSNAMIVTNYESVTADNAWEFRNKLQEMNSTFEVVKKRVFLKAAIEAGLEVDLEELGGHIGVVFASDDTLGPTKHIYSFSNQNGAKLNVLYGVFEGQKYKSEDVEALSKLPNLPEMRAQFLGLLEAPMSQTLSVMQSLLTSVIYCLDNKSKQTS